MEATSAQRKIYANLSLYHNNLSRSFTRISVSKDNVDLVDRSMLLKHSRTTVPSRSFLSNFSLALAQEWVVHLNADETRIDRCLNKGKVMLKLRINETDLESQLLSSY